MRRSYFELGKGAQALLRTTWDKAAYTGLLWRLATRHLPEPREVHEEKKILSGDDTSFISSELKRAGVIVSEYRHEDERYKEYLSAADYGSAPAFYGERNGIVFEEKSLEHYLSFRLLSLCDSDTYVDIASESSPAPDIARALYGCRTYRQDLIYDEGVHGDRIGSDATHLPVRDGFATKISLHCSFEHFEGDTDGGFIRECARLLAPGGKACIVPLYLGPVYRNYSDPTFTFFRRPVFDEDAVVTCVKRGHNRFERHYDIDSFVRRFVANLSGLDLTVYDLRQVRIVYPGTWVSFAAVLEKPG
jgi:SAM-dependent methyltransferase